MSETHAEAVPDVPQVEGQALQEPEQLPPLRSLPPEADGCSDPHELQVVHDFGRPKTFEPRLLEVLWQTRNVSLVEHGW